MNIILAIDNEFVKEKISEIYKEKVFKYDLVTKEELIEFLSIKKDPYIVITKDNLSGDLDSKMYIKQIRFASPESKVIYIVDKLESEYKQFLFANEVFNILESSNLNIQNIIDSIEEDNKVIYKEIQSENVEKIKEPYIEYKVKVENKVIPKKKIAIYGTSGSGKSFISSVVSKHICNDLNLSIALLDMDIQNPSIDIFNNIDNNSDGLTQIIDDLDKRRNVSNIIDKYMIKDNNRKLWYMTNNASIFDIQNKFSNKYYEKIYNGIMDKFDFSVIDLPSSPFLDVVPYTLTECDNIFFVINPNYVSIRQAIKYLELLTKLWNISKDKIKIIVNKVQKNSLENVQIENLLEGYEVVLNIPYIKDIDSYINGAITNINLDIDMKKIYEYFGILNKNSVNNIGFSFKNILKRVGV